LLDKSYEIKFNQTQSVDHLNRALVWAKQNLWLDNYKIQYEGFYFYRRYNNRENPPAEQRITNLYIKLYDHTKNKNYLSFALKYAELMRHKPITQIGVNQHLYASLPQMVSIDNGRKQELNQAPDYFSKLITQPEYVAQFLNNNEALVSYFCYVSSDSDSLTFLVQGIKKKIQFDMVLKTSKLELGNLPENIFNSVEQNDLGAYKTNAFLAYNLLFKPVINKLGSDVKKLVIISPAYFNKPILFEGFIKNLNGNNYSNLSYVFDDVNISYATSLTHFVTFKKKQVVIDKVTIWNPDYTNTPLAEITEGEIINKNISKYFHTQKINYSSKKELAETLLKSKVFQISAHAYASFDDLERPIIYTALHAEDSVLYDIDFEKLKSQNVLAVFAACKSNVGIMQHNGIIDGFTRATLSAGGAGTVCAIRNVEESVTTQLLDLFYKNLSNGNCSSDALYLAKKEIKQRYSNPKIWQAFIYTGSDQNFISRRKGAENWYTILILVGIGIILWLSLKPNFN
jgi:CHAT domain-containing protein